MSDLYIVGLPEDEVIDNLRLEVDSTATADQSVAWGWKNPETPVFAKRCFRFYPPAGELVTTITTFPTRGKAIINGDNTITVQLTEYEYEGDPEAQTLVYDTDATTGVSETYAILPSRLDLGFHNGDTYFHRLDSSGNQVIEYDDNLRDIYIANDGLSRADIVALEPSLSVESDVTPAWLASNVANGEADYYGATEALRLDEFAGRLAIAGVMVGNNLSVRALFKGGDSFPADEAGSQAIIGASASGYNDRFPYHITSYGTGRATVDLECVSGAATSVMMTNMDASLFKMDGLKRGGIERIDGTVAKALSHNQGKNGDGTFKGDGYSCYRSTAFDGWKDTPGNPSVWAASSDRVSPSFITNVVDGFFAENIWDHAGWKEGYNPYSNSTTAGWYDPDGTYYASDPNNGTAEYFSGTSQPPSQYSQTGYRKLSAGMTFRNEVFARGALTACQCRSGAVAIGNVYLDFNNAGNFFGGDYNQPSDRYTGSYTIFGRNILTSVAYKESEPRNGLSSQSAGMSLGSSPITVDENIVMHARNPDDLTNEEYKERVDSAPLFEVPGVSFPYDNNIIYNWSGSVSGSWEQNIDGLSVTTLDTTTIQRFTDILKNEPVGANSIGDLFDYAQDDMAEPGVLAGQICRYFYDACSVEPVRTTAGTATFLPTEHGDGLRWDVYLNWDINTLPGTDVKDDIDLNGYDTRLGCGIVFEIADLDFGDDGSLVVNNTQLTLDSLTTTDGTATMGAVRQYRSCRDSSANQHPHSQCLDGW